MDERIKRKAIKTGQLTPALDSIKEMLKLITDVRDEALLNLALDIGARREDLVKIEIPNIDFENNSITFYQSKKRYFHKSYIQDSTKAIILKYLATRKDKKRFLFPAEYKGKQKALSGRQAYNIYNKYLKRADIIKDNETLPFHTLRSLCIKFKERAGWTEQQTAEQIDDRIETIQKHYSTPSKDDMKRLVKEKPAI